MFISHNKDVGKTEVIQHSTYSLVLFTVYYSTHKAELYVAGLKYIFLTIISLLIICLILSGAHNV